MARVRRSLALRVYMNNVPVGTLRKLITGGLTFEYDSDWVNSSSSIPLSLSLPLTSKVYSGDVVINYFDNLLPDNEGIRKALAQRMLLNNQEVFDLLAAIGRDCVGAVQLIPIDEPMTDSSKIKSNPISDEEIGKTLKNLKNYPLGIKPEADFRISIAGAQEKTAFLKLKNKWHLPHGSTPSSHIFKVQMGMLRETIDMTKSVENEWLCLEICKAFGIPTAEAEITDFDGVRALIVERFDREFSDKAIFRYAQEDFCQVMGIPSHKKYQHEGGPSISQIIDVLTKSDNPSRDKRLFLMSQLVFWLLAATDGHAKNFSVFLVPGGISLTPLYDVMSVYPPAAKNQIQLQKVKLAMAVGEKNHYELRDIVRRHWHQTAKITKFPEQEMESIIEHVVKKTDSVIMEVSQNLPSSFPKEISQPIFDGMGAALKVLKK